MNLSEKLQAALELRFDSDAGENLTIRYYLYTLLITLWVEQDGFSGKRPFGNSGWEYDLYVPLIKAGFVKGKLDKDGYVDEIDETAGEAFVQQMIRAAFYGAGKGQAAV